MADMIVEVFKTTVKSQDHANMLITEIHKVFATYKANFDLEDCDNILRVESSSEIDSFALITLLQNVGYDAEILPDDGLQESITQKLNL